MLKTHQTDRMIIEAVGRVREGGTVSEIRDEMLRVEVGALSCDTIRRHLPGLMNRGLIRRVGDARGVAGGGVFVKAECCDRSTWE